MQLIISSLSFVFNTLLLTGMEKKIFPNCQTRLTFFWLVWLGVVIFHAFQH